MKKTIGMLSELIKPIELGLKTQTIRLLKFDPETTPSFKNQYKAFNPKIHSNDNFPAIQSVLKKSKYIKGDCVHIEHSELVIEILSVDIKDISSLTHQILSKEGLKFQTNWTDPYSILYFDYLTEKYSFKNITQSFLSIMTKCYGQPNVNLGSYVFVYHFKLIS